MTSYDILVKRCPDNSFMTSVYRKKTFTGLYTKWDSFTPRKYKINLIRILTYRCFRICSSTSLLHSAIQDLRKLLLQNGYPQGIITYNVNHVLNRHKNKPDTPVATVPKKASFTTDFWLDFIVWCRNANIALEELSDIDKLFGVWKRKEDFLLLNHLLILAKHHIYECRKNNTRPSLGVFIKILNYIYHLELYTMKSNNQEDSHNLKWKKIS